MALHRWSPHCDTQLSTHMGRRGREARWEGAGWEGAGWGTIALLGCGLLCCCFDNGGERVGGDKTHEEEGLEDGVGELWSLLEEFGSFCWFG